MARLKGIEQAAETEPPAATPEQALLMAVLLRAIGDVQSPQVMAREGFQRAHNENEARDYIFSDEMRPFSFLWICEHVTSDPIGMAKHVRNAINSGGCQGSRRLRHNRVNHGRGRMYGYDYRSRKSA